MPNVVFNIDDSFATITRFVGKSVLDQLMHITSITGAELIFNEPLGYGKNSAANADPDANALRLDANDYVIVKMNERFDEQTIDPMTSQDEHIPIFKHSKLGIQVRPITARANIEFEITYRSKSYNTLSTWLARFQRNKIPRNPHNYHDILYNYTIPQVIVAYLYDVYYLQQNVAPPSPVLTMKEWNNKHYTQGLMSRSNLAGNNNALAVNVVSKGNLGYFTSLPEDISTDKDKMLHEINFSYRLTYDKVTDLLLEYQLYVHNQRISNEYDPFFIREDHPVDKHQGLRTFTGFVNTVTERGDWYKVEPIQIFFDNVDKWIPESTLQGTTTMLMVPIQLNPDDLREVVNLSDIPDEKLPANVKIIIQALRTQSVIPYGSPFMVELFAVDDKTKNMPITINSNGDITTTTDMDLRKRHYLRISLLLDFSRLPTATLKLLSQHPSWVIFILNTIDPQILMKYSLDILGNGTAVSMASLYEIVQKLKGRGPYGGGLTLGYLSDYYNNSWNGNLLGYYVDTNRMAISVTAKRGT